MSGRRSIILIIAAGICALTMSKIKSETINTALSQSQIYPVRVKFWWFQQGKRPLRCKGILCGIMPVSADAESQSFIGLNIINFKCSKLYMKHAVIPLKNVRFAKELNSILTSTKELSEYFSNHFENRKEKKQQLQKLTKFSFL
jgi:hypothetical protein